MLCLTMAYFLYSKLNCFNYTKIRRRRSSRNISSTGVSTRKRYLIECLPVSISVLNHQIDQLKEEISSKNISTTSVLTRKRCLIACQPVSAYAGLLLPAITIATIRRRHSSMNISSTSVSTRKMYLIACQPASINP